MALAILAGVSLAPGCSGGGAPTGAAPTPAKTYGQTIDNGAVGTPAANAKTLLAIYMIGSDLEDDLKPRNGVSDEEEAGAPVTTGNGTTNLKQAVAAYQALPDAQKANADLVVAMGGSRKAGWKGIKYLDLPTLAADSKDGLFGNEGPYLYADPDADMGDQATIARFLDFVKARAAGHGKVMVELWNHGGAYVGVGPDTNHQSDLTGGMMGIEKLKAALTQTGFKGDLIGFDACLMGNLEVAEALKDHFTYLVASEEVEPYHGWDYGLIVPAMAQDPPLSALDFGKKIVDIFIESPLHQKTKKRTLGVSELAKTGAVTSSLDALAGDLKANLDPNFQTVLTAAGGSQYYGRHTEVGSEFSLDLRDFVGQVPAASSVSASAKDLDAAVKAMVCYARESGEKPRSNGLTIFSPVNAPFFDGGIYKAEVAASTTWYDFLTSFVDRAKNAPLPPSVGAESPVAAAPGAAAFRTLLSFQAPKPGFVPDGSFKMQVSGDPGVAHVNAMHVVQPDPAKHRYWVVASDRLKAEPDGQYVLPGWDGAAIHLAAGAGSELLAPLTFDTETAFGTAVFVAPARVNDEEVSLYVEWDRARQAAVAQWTVPFRGNTMSKLQNELVAGDRVQFYYSYVDTDAKGKTAELSPAVTLAATPTWIEKKVAGQKLYFLAAEDLKGRITASPLHLVLDLLGDLDALM